MTTEQDIRGESPPPRLTLFICSLATWLGKGRGTIWLAINCHVLWRCPTFVPTRRKISGLAVVTPVFAHRRCPEPWIKYVDEHS